MARSSAFVTRLHPKFTESEMESLLGTYVDIDDSWTVATDESCFMRDDDSVIAILRKNVIPTELVDIAIKCYKRVGMTVSTNRGYASGMTTRGKSHAKYDRGREANSGIMGFIDNTNLRRPCRLTQFSRNHFETYSRGLPFIQCIDRCFASALPDAHARQLAEASKTEFHIPSTAFSTVTVNYNFRTSVHKDSGDYRDGFGNLVVCQRGVEGGYILFPRYKLAIAADTGDFVAMDVHEYHCNSPIVLRDPANGYRLSFVCYLRERMLRCTEINAKIEKMNGTTDDWIRDIFMAFGEEDIPEKQVIGEGRCGHEWWEMTSRSEKLTLRYKNKRYTLIDHTRSNLCIHELGPAWEYAMKIAEYESNNHHQFQGDDGSYPAQ